MVVMVTHIAPLRLASAPAHTAAAIGRVAPKMKEMAEENAAAQGLVRSSLSIPSSNLRCAD